LNTNLHLCSFFVQFNNSSKIRKNSFFWRWWRAYNIIEYIKKSSLKCIKYIFNKFFFLKKKEREGKKKEKKRKKEITVLLTCTPCIAPLKLIIRESTSALLLCWMLPKYFSGIDGCGRILYKFLNRFKI
jgi:hypothetical protein